jgi:hypothetical protein
VTPNEAAPVSDSVDDLQLDALTLLQISQRADAPTVLQGATETLWRTRCSIVIGMPDEGAGGGLARMLHDVGYRCWTFRFSLFNPANRALRDRDIFGGAVAHVLVALPEEREVPKCMAPGVEVNASQ